MKGKIIAVALYGVSIMTITFALGFLVGARPSECKTLSQKIEVADVFCANIVAQAIEANCPADLSEQDLAGCQGIVTIRAGMACHELTGRSEIAELMDKGCR